MKKVPEERAITMVGAHLGLSLKKINELLAHAGFGPMNKNSYKSEVRDYAPAIFGDSSSYTLEEHIYKPRGWSKDELNR